MLSIDTKKALAAVLENLNKAASEVPAFVPVTDSTYIRRLEKALTKNFDYIRRLLQTLSSQYHLFIHIIANLRSVKILLTATISDLMIPEMTYCSYRKDAGQTNALQKKFDATASTGGKQSNGHGYPKEISSSNARPGNSGSDGNKSTEHFLENCELLSYERVRV